MKRLSLWLLMFVCFVASAETVHIAITDDFRDVVIGKGIEYLPHISSTSAGSDELPGAASQWQPYEKNSIDMGNIASAYWFRFALSNKMDTDVTLILEIDNPLLDYVQLHQVDQGAVTNVWLLGDLQPFGKRQIAHESLLFPIKLAAQQSSMIYLKVINDGLFSVPLELWQEESYIESNSQSSLLSGLLFGFLLATIATSFLLFVITRARKFALLGITLSVEMMALMTLFGIANRYFWPDWPWLQQHIVSMLMASTLICAAVFGLSLLNVRRLSVRILQTVRALIAIGGVLVLLSLLVAVHVSIVILLLYAMVLSLVMMAVGVWCWQRKVNAAELFTISWAVSSLCFVYVAFWAGLGIELPMQTLDVFVFNAVISTVLLSAALIKQYIGEKSHQIRAQQQAIAEISSHEKMQQQMLAVEEQSREELEISIQERTFELEVTLRELQEKNLELEQKNTQDALTGIRNRRFFDKKYLAEFRRSRREQTELSLLMLDIDHFKAVNDTYGHLAGDDVIRYVGRTIEDIVKRPSDDVCRYGGEEFTVILPSTDADGARQLGETIRQAIESAKIETPAGILSITISCGICTDVAQNDMNENHYVDMADKSLYAAKERGRNCVVHHTEISADELTG